MHLQLCASKNTSANLGKLKLARDNRMPMGVALGEVQQSKQQQQYEYVIRYQLLQHTLQHCRVALPV